VAEHPLVLKRHAGALEALTVSGRDVPQSTQLAKQLYHAHNTANNGIG